MLKASSLVLVTLMCIGCDNSVVNREALLAAKQIVQNRKTFAKEIITATNDCIKAATSVQTLAAASNDQAETVRECKEASQEAYGANSPYNDEWLARAAVR